MTDTSTITAMVEALGKERDDARAERDAAIAELEKRIDRCGGACCVPSDELVPRG